ncbi:MAG: hypothetical protein BJ554DRAFT_4400 [Olpidium bornovanus]|uniref:Uncharacterized protein n=1 Tax=Olpidium bornovanus TaxID=278681 RepID=A0A8H8A088_9FUNG|nr:MAG: hypothetical protein BJ554DRAFT_4400 [Olpidium bornovanus]
MIQVRPREADGDTRSRAGPAATSFWKEGWGDWGGGPAPPDPAAEGGEGNVARGARFPVRAVSEETTAPRRVGITLEMGLTPQTIAEKKNRGTKRSPSPVPPHPPPHRRIKHPRGVPVPGPQVTHLGDLADPAAVGRRPGARAGWVRRGRRRGSRGGPKSDERRSARGRRTAVAVSREMGHGGRRRGPVPPGGGLAARGAVGRRVCAVAARQLRQAGGSSGGGTAASVVLSDYLQAPVAPVCPEELRRPVEPGRTARGRPGRRAGVRCGAYRPRRRETRLRQRRQRCRARGVGRRAGSAGGATAGAARRPHRPLQEHPQGADGRVQVPTSRVHRRDLDRPAQVPARIGGRAVEGMRPRGGRFSGWLCENGRGPLRAPPPCPL